MLRVALPGGVDVALRPVAGEDEAWMLEAIGRRDASDARDGACRALHGR